MKMRLKHSCFPVKLAKFLRTPILNNICHRLLLCRIVALGAAAYKCRNTKNKFLNLTFFSLPRNRKIALCEEQFEEPWFNKSVDSGKRSMNSKD